MKNILSATLAFPLLVAGLAAGVLPAPATAHDVPACVVDNARKDPSFVAYRDKLMAAIKARDVQTVVAAADPRIQLSFGGDAGRKTFATRLTKARQTGKDPVGNPIWELLETVLDGGGLFDQDQGYAAPYYYAVSPPKGLKDEFDMFVTGSLVLVRAAPNSNADVLDRVSCDYVKALDTEWEATWRKIETRAGTVGYMASRFLRHQFDYRAGFSKKSGTWQMTFFLAGD